MSKVLKLVKGIPEMVEVTPTLSFYDEIIEVDNEIGIEKVGAYDDEHKIFTLPSSKTYNGMIKELKVYCNKLALVEGKDFEYEADTSATTIITYKAVPINSIMRFVIVY